MSFALTPGLEKYVVSNAICFISFLGHPHQQRISVSVVLVLNALISIADARHILLWREGGKSFQASWLNLALLAAENEFNGANIKIAFLGRSGNFASMHPITLFPSVPPPLHHVVRRQSDYSSPDYRPPSFLPTPSSHKQSPSHSAPVYLNPIPHDVAERRSDDYHDHHGGYHPKGKVGPVYTFVKTDYHGNFKMGVRHVAGKTYAG